MIFVCVFMAGYALASSMFGNLLPEMIGYYGIDLGKASSINIFNEIGNTGAMVFALLAVDRMDKRRLLPLTALCYGAALFLDGLMPAFLLLLVTRLAIGFTGGLLDNLCATYVSDLYGERRTRYISILHTLYAIGSLIGPKFAALTITLGGWALSYLSSGIAMLIVAVLFFVVIKALGAPALAVAPAESARQKIPYGEILHSANMRWLCAGNMLFSSLIYINVWLPTYLSSVDRSIYTVGFCSTVMTASYIGMILSRTILAALSEKISTAAYVRWSALLAAGLLAAMLIVQQPVFWLIGIFLFSLVSGANYTARFVLACQEFPAYSSTATALAGFFAALGNILLNAGLGALAGAGRYTLAFFLLVGLLAAAFFLYTFGYKDPQRR